MSWSYVTRSRHNGEQTENLEATEIEVEDVAPLIIDDIKDDWCLISSTNPALEESSFSVDEIDDHFPSKSSEKEAPTGPTNKQRPVDTAEPSHSEVPSKVPTEAEQESSTKAPTQGTDARFIDTGLPPSTETKTEQLALVKTSKLPVCPQELTKPAPATTNGHPPKQQLLSEEQAPVKRIHPVRQPTVPAPLDIADFPPPQRPSNEQVFQGVGQMPRHHRHQGPWHHVQQQAQTQAAHTQAQGLTARDEAMYGFRTSNGPRIRYRGNDDHLDAYVTHAGRQMGYLPHQHQQPSQSTSRAGPHLLNTNTDRRGEPSQHRGRPSQQRFRGGGSWAPHQFR